MASYPAGNGIIRSEREITTHSSRNHGSTIKWDKFPAHVALEQFSPVLPNNYRESSYPVAVYRWHAENPTNKTVIVSVLLSWTNMSGWFRTFTRDFNGTPNQGNHNDYVSEKISGTGTMKGIVFDRNRAGNTPNEWDGQFAIAAIDSPGVEVTYQTTYQASGDGKAVWAPFSKDGRLADDTEIVGKRQGKTGRRDRAALHSAARREESRSHGHRVGLPGGSVRRRKKVESPLHGFLRNLWPERLEDCSRWTAPCRRVERCDRQMAGALYQR